MVKLSIIPIAIGSLLIGPLADASVLTPGNIIVATAFSDQTTTKFGEYTPSGALVQSYSINVPNGTEQVVSGITVGTNLQPYVFSGSFNPQLWSINTSNNAQSTRTVSGWSNVGNTVTGGAASYLSYVFVTSEKASSSNGGVFRFNLSNGTALQMFNPNPISVGGNTSYDKITIGYDNKLYALFNNGGFSSPYLVTADPISGAGFTVATLSKSVNAIAVDANGHIYALRGASNSTGEGIDEFSPSHTLLRSLNFPNGTLTGTPSSIQLSATGNILATSNSGTILQTTTDLATYSTFSIASTLGVGKTVRYTQAAVVQTPVPEPTCLAVVAMASLLLAQRRRRHGYVIDLDRC